MIQGATIRLGRALYVYRLKLRLGTRDIALIVGRDCFHWCCDCLCVCFAIEFAHDAPDPIARERELACVVALWSWCVDDSAVDVIEARFVARTRCSYMWYLSILCLDLCPWGKLKSHRLFSVRL